MEKRKLLKEKLIERLCQQYGADRVNPVVECRNIVSTCARPSARTYLTIAHNIQSACTRLQTQGAQGNHHPGGRELQRIDGGHSNEQRASRVGEIHCEDSSGRDIAVVVISETWRSRGGLFL